MILTAILTALVAALPQDSLRTSAFYTDSSGVSIYEPDTLSRVVAFPDAAATDTAGMGLPAPSRGHGRQPARVRLSDDAVVLSPAGKPERGVAVVRDTAPSTGAPRVTFEPLWDRRAEVDRGITNLQSVIDQDGNYWKTYDVDGMYIFLNVRRLRQYGHYWQVDAYIQNNTDTARNLDMSKARVEFVGGSRPVLTEEDYLRRVKRRQFWSAFGISAATFATAVVADIATESLYGNLYDGDISFASDIAATVAVQSLYAVSYVGSVALGEKFSRDYARITAENIGWLRSSTVRPSHAIEGYALVRAARKAGDIVITLNIGGRDYFFTWDSRKLEKVD